MPQIHFPDIKDFEEMTIIGEQIFYTEDDDTQSKASVENCIGISNVDPYCYVSIKENDKNMAWSIVLPTSIDNMNKFLKGEINEAQLSEASKSNPCFECLYFMAVIVLPEYRKMGLAKFLLKEQIKYFQEKYSIDKFFGWIFTKDGNLLADSMKKEFEDLDVSLIISPLI